MRTKMGEESTGVSLRVRHQANLPAVRTILLDQFNLSLQEKKGLSFLPHEQEFQFRKFCLPRKPVILPLKT